MKKKLFSLLLALVMIAALPLPVLAAEDGGVPDNMTFYATSCVRNGIEYDTYGEYILFSRDGKGIIVYNANAYPITWEYDSQSEVLTFTDNRGSQGVFLMNETGFSGEYRTIEYTFEPGSDAPILSLFPGRFGSGLPKVADQAEILIESEKSELAQRAEEISSKYGCDVHIVTVDNYRSYTMYKSIETFAEELRVGYDIGQGRERNCIVLILSMADRDYDLVAYGDFANASFTDYGKTYISDRFLDDFKDNDWYTGFSDYLSACEKLLDMSANGKPMDVNNRPQSASDIVGAAIASLVIGLLIAFIVCTCLKAGMKSTKEQTTAENYIPQNGVDITYRYDMYTHTTETRVYDPPESKSGGGSGGGGGGTSVSSSGHSHSSGKF